MYLLNKYLVSVLSEKFTLCWDLKVNGNEKRLQIVYCGFCGLVVGDKYQRGKWFVENIEFSYSENLGEYGVYSGIGRNWFS